MASEDKEWAEFDRLLDAYVSRDRQAHDLAGEASVLRLAALRARPTGMGVGEVERIANLRKAALKSNPRSVEAVLSLEDV